MFRIMRITGDSMSPDYQDGDFVFLMNLFRGRIKRGDVIVFINQLYGTLIKRVEKITDEGIYVLGTGENSLDSRRLGPVNPAAVQGKVIWHIHRR
ncbi:MAG: peptidase S24 [Anaerolineales bacterium]|uniref:Peptidase S24 n=1 Tax=Candidatus Desulfolinea nitratireducens TaxID=2841698 RepID=A0A8J6THP6_9CHLR|nr:peptidase S24 [Candidatus Desulfolinea nitratireducens]MBL6961889.1 peptidase S24 [Anaerolineales bacterium]